MTMTEEQAKTKWCPYARTLEFEEFNTGPAVGASVNRAVGWAALAAQEVADIKPRHRCIASECMAWRTVDKRLLLDVGTEPGGAWVKRGEPVDSALPLEIGDKDQEWVLTGGYCGLAGAP